MDWPTMERVLETAGRARANLVDITGGAPEINPSLPRFIAAARDEGRQVQVRTNLTVLLEPELRSMGEFFRDHEVTLIASLPCYLEENVDAQRGPHAYERSIKSLRQLNALGYGVDSRLALNLVFNPAGPFLPPEQNELEADYRRELAERYDIRFTNLWTITNMPIGRFAEILRSDRQEEAYMHLLVDAFNPQTVPGLMCRHQISVAWDGTLYDCDFNLALDLPVNHSAPSHLRDFNTQVFTHRRIVTGSHCFGCTAGCGSSCGGSLS